MSKKELKMEIIEKKLSEIKPYENNPRINDDAVQYVANSIKKFGFRVPIIIDKDNTIIAGHTRYKACEELGIDNVPCVYADDLTPEQVKAYRIADNKTSEQSLWNNELLKVELKELMDFDMTDFGFGEFEIAELLRETEPISFDVPDSFDEMESLKTEHKCPKCGYEW